MQPVLHLRSVIDTFAEHKQETLDKWVSFDVALEVLQRHDIEASWFTQTYGSGVYEYFVKVIRGERAIGDCPAIAELLEYLKDHDISADELFLLCSHFRRAMVDTSYEIGVNSQEVYDEISYVFDLNFAGVLKRYTETIYQKEREIERNVKLLEEYRRAIDESAIVAKTDADGVLTYANDKLSRICGYGIDELVGSPHNIVCHPDMPKPFFKTLWETIKQNRVFRSTIKNRAKDGSAFYVDTTIVPITDTRGEITEYMAISYEVTDLVVAKEDAIAASEAKEYFLSNMSHEIRTPLNAILGFVALLKDEARTDKDRRYLDIIYSSGENLLSIINDILDFSKLRSGEFTVEPKTFNLHRVITHTLELFVPSVNQHHLTLTSFIDPRIPYELISDPLRIQQVISNLLSNAIKFTPPGGEIKVEASFAADSITVHVIDTGIGIAAKDQEHIFDPFSQARSDEVSGRGGTGLGLSISAQLVRHMGGEITVHSRPGIGSTFSFTLPVTVGGENRPGLMDIAKVQRLNLALFLPRGSTDVMADSLERYLSSFGITLQQTQSVAADYDLLFYSELQIDDAQREALLSDPRPKVALMDAPYDTYETAENVTPLVMPLYCAKLQEVMETALSAEPQIRSKAQVRSRKFNAHILVAEDNEANQELIGTLLENMGVTYTMVNNGVSALKQMQTDEYDLVLMDEQMPKMNGNEAAKAMRDIERKTGQKHLPVIALSANVLGSSEQRSVYDEFLGKPIRMDALVKALAHYLPSEDVSEFSSENGEEPASMIDKEELCDILQVSDAQLQQLLDVYRDKMKQSLQALQEAVMEHDLKRITLLAHSIKGSSGNFRLETMTQLAERIELAARADKAGFDYEAQYTKLVESFEMLHL
jgi:PAS domain S-box-containing protein